MGQYKGIQLQHLTFSQIVNDLFAIHNKSIDKIDFIFTIVRNPIDRIISEANWQINHEYFQYKFSWENILDQFSNDSKQNFCHYLHQKYFLENYEDNIKVYSIDNLKELKDDFKVDLGIDLNVENSFMNKSKKVFEFNSLSNDVKNRINESSRIDKDYFINNKDKFSNISEYFFRRLGN